MEKNYPIGIRIISCRDPLLWYSNKKTTIVPFICDLDRDTWLSREDAGYTNIVYKHDGELVYEN